MKTYEIEYHLKNEEEWEDGETKELDTRLKAQRFVNKLIRDKSCSCIIWKVLDEDGYVDKTFEFNFETHKWE